MTQGATTLGSSRELVVALPATLLFIYIYIDIYCDSITYCYNRGKYKILPTLVDSLLLFYKVLPTNGGFLKAK